VPAIPASLTAKWPQRQYGRACDRLPAGVGHWSTAYPRESCCTNRVGLIGLGVAIAMVAKMPA
jgi:hypothetical protein